MTQSMNYNVVMVRYRCSNNCRIEAIYWSTLLSGNAR